LLRLEEVYDNDENLVRLVNIRNPWAQTEWTGDWSDNSDRWDELPEETRDELLVQDNDGAFWMSFKDWVDEFEMFTICILPDEDFESDRDHRVIGTFIGGENCPLDAAQLQSDFLTPNKTVQMELIVENGDQRVFFQYLLDSPLKCSRYLMLNVFKGIADEDGHKHSKRTLRHGRKVNPALPRQSGYVIDYYRHNGYMFHLEEGRYVIVITTATPSASTDPCRFLFRAVAPDIQLTHLH
jgi:hypothetical protein